MIQRTNRRAFLANSIAAGIGLMAIAACSGNAQPSGATSPAQGNLDCEDGLTTSYLNPGHNHGTVILTAEQLEQAVPGNYVLLDGSHSHNFQLAAEDFVALGSGQAIQKEDLEGHGHIIEVSC